MQTIQSVALIGMGALGILYGHTMARKMKEGAVTFLVDEKRKQRYRADPPTFNGEPCRFAFCAPEDYPGAQKANRQGSPLKVGGSAR